MKKQIAGLLIIAGLFSLVLTGCLEPNNDEKQAQQTEQIQQQSSAKLGMPNIKNFYEKEILKNVMEACDNSKLITYAYLQSSMSGKLEYLGQAMGYGVPYGTEYTNPEYIPGATSTSTSLPQADPNGLYKATNVSATWLMLIDPVTKQAKPIYCEPNLVVSQFKLPKSMIDPDTLPSDY